MTTNNNDIHNIDSFTDNELFDILDLNSPTDRELEAKILFYIRKYKDLNNEAADKLVTFFENVYDHFFESIQEEQEDSNGIEGFDVQNTEAISLSNFLIPTSQNNQTISLSNYSTPTFSANPSPTYSTPTQTQTYTTPEYSLAKKNNKVLANDKVLVDYTKLYTQDTLNPLLKQTIKRIISVDSQYREDKNALSTSFNFNLSEPLKDIVSIKLYSLQIPYTWYTINNNYGSNTFTLINNKVTDGSCDLSFNIEPGNYTITNLQNAVKKSITNAFTTTYTDFNINNTDISYDPINALCNFTFDIKKCFNEVAYNLSIIETKYRFSYRIASISSSHDGQYQCVIFYDPRDNVILPYLYISYDYGKSFIDTKWEKNIINTFYVDYNYTMYDNSNKYDASSNNYYSVGNYGLYNMTKYGLYSFYDASMLHPYDPSILDSSIIDNSYCQYYNINNGYTYKYNNYKDYIDTITVTQLSPNICITSANGSYITFSTYDIDGLQPNMIVYSTNYGSNWSPYIALEQIVTNNTVNGTNDKIGLI
jgi:hypothetical protein